MSDSPLYISVALLPSLISSGSLAEHCGAVVIDTLRFTTTAVQALSAGALTVRAVGEIDMAVAWAEQSSDPKPLLCGERNCRPIAGFQLGNSPLEYLVERVDGHHLVFTTTNGTRALKATRLHVDCVLAALVNRAAVAEYLASSKLSYWQLIAAGTDGHVAGEDTITAGAIIDHLLAFPGNRSIFLDDSAWLALDCWRQANDLPNLSSYLMKYLGAVHLMQAGYDNDILFASKLDLLSVVPRRIEIDLDHHVFHRLC